MKRKHFDGDQKFQMVEKMNWIRLQTEKDRINKFKKVTNEPTKKYYGVLE
jgi:hypothetical protein